MADFFLNPSVFGNGTPTIPGATIQGSNTTSIPGAIINTVSNPNNTAIIGGQAPAPQQQDPSFSTYDWAADQARRAAAQDSALRQQQSGLINQIFDSRIGRLRSVFDRIPTQQDQALNQYNSVYDQNLQQLNNSAEQGRNLSLIHI